MQQKSTFFTRKQLRSLLFVKNASNILINPQNEDLADFTTDFYHLLAKANEKVGTFEREKGNRRLDAMARLIVGDEICAAVAFDGKNLLISTNRNNHTHDIINARQQWIIKEGSSVREQLNIQLLLHVSYKDHRVKIPVKEEVIYKYNKHQKALKLIQGPGKVKIEPWEHMIPDLPDFELNLNLKKQMSPYTFCDNLQLKHLNKKKPDISLLKKDLPRAIEPLIHVPINPLKRRVDSLIDHLSYISKITFGEKRGFDRNIIEKARDCVDKFRDRVLFKTFAWEAAKWYRDTKGKGANPNVPFSGDTYTGELGKLIEAFNEDYIKFKNTNLQGESISTFVKKWIDSVIGRIKDENFQVPEFVQKKPILLMRCWRYFVDLEKLEKYIEDEAKKMSPLALLLAKERFLEDKTLSIIVDDLEENVHAEMRLFWRILKSNAKVDYIATSKTCCAHCALVLCNHGIVNISGLHGNAYGNWVLSKSFIQPEFLHKILGDLLYDKLQKLTLKNTQFEHSNYSKASLAFMIMESIASLNEEDFKVLGIQVKKLTGNKEELAHESDDEDVNEKADEHLQSGENQTTQPLWEKRIDTAKSATISR